MLVLCLHHKKEADSDCTAVGQLLLSTREIEICVIYLLGNLLVHLVITGLISPWNNYADGNLRIIVWSVRDKG